MKAAITTSASPLLIIVTGPSASGKTTLGRALAEALDLPFLGRDDLKEIMYETLGIADRAWSRRLGGASYELLYHALELLQQARASCVVESNFDPAYAAPRLRALQQRFPFRALQIVCCIGAEERLRRALTRAANGERHLGHVEHRLYIRAPPPLRPVLHSLARLRLALHPPPADIIADWRLVIDSACVGVDMIRLNQAGRMALFELARSLLPKESIS
jgi:predicted kinase